MKTFNQHKWSGWPGAYCLNCGCEDPREVCLALHGGHFIPCDSCTEETVKGCLKCGEVGIIGINPCPDFLMTECERFKE